MSSYLSNILTNTTSKYNTLRQNLTSSENDGDTEDDSHISRVLRAYYTEKGRQFPQWLPPDPRRTASSQSVASTFTSSLRNPTSPQLQQPSQKGSLSDLWDQPSQRAPSPQQPMSLRRQAVQQGGRGGGGGGGGGGTGSDMLQPGHAHHNSQGRPLPSQRAGSYQSVASHHSQNSQSQYNDPSPPQSSGSMSSLGGGGTAQERLKARLWGKSGSSTNLSLQGQQQQPHGRDRFGPR